MGNVSLLKECFEKNHDFLEAIASIVRQEIIIELASIYPNGKRIKEFQIKKCLTRPTMSHHLKLLNKAGIVSYQSIGTKNYYYLSIDPASLDVTQNILNSLNQYVGKKNDPSN